MRASRFAGHNLVMAKTNKRGTTTKLSKINPTHTTKNAACRRPQRGANFWLLRFAKVAGRTEPSGKKPPYPKRCVQPSRTSSSGTQDCNDLLPDVNSPTIIFLLASKTRTKSLLLSPQSTQSTHCCVNSGLSAIRRRKSLSANRLHQKIYSRQCNGRRAKFEDAALQQLTRLLGSPRPRAAEQRIERDDHDLMANLDP